MGAQVLETLTVGASAGTLLGDRLAERLRDTLVAALGLFTSGAPRRWRR